MPRKRRQPKRRLLPQSITEIAPMDRCQWSVSGPLLEAGVEGAVVGHTIWPDWDTWAEFYRAVRDELHGDRPWLRERSAAERLYQGWLAGGDLDAMQAEIAAAVRANDPRRALMGGGHLAT